jgi:hypothetical protein
MHHVWNRDRRLCLVHHVLKRGQQTLCSLAAEVAGLQLQAQQVGMVSNTEK